MTIERIHQEIKNRWNKLNSNHKVDFSPAYLDDAINKAQDDYVEIFYSGNNSKQYKFGFEVTQARIDMLEKLVKSYQGAPVVLSGKYHTLISALIPSYRHFLRGSVVVTGCVERVPLTLVRLNDLDSKTKDANTKPSKRWNRAFVCIYDNKLNYLAEGVITEVEFNYLKDPKPVFSGGYTTLEFLSGDDSGYTVASPKVTSEIDPSFHDLLVDMTVQYLARVFEDQTKFEFQKELIINKT